MRILFRGLRKFKLLTALFAIAAVSVSVLTAQQELDLGEVFIWGDDRSVLPGLSGEGISLYPYLNKSSFLSPSGSGAGKSLPDSGLSAYGGGLNIRAGAGNSGEYLLHAAGSRYSRPGWFYGWEGGWKRDSTDAADEDFSELRLSAAGGQSQDQLSWSAGAEGSASDFISRRALWRASGGLSWEPGFMTLTPSLFLSGAHRGKEGYGAGFSLEATKNFFYYHRLTIEAAAGMLFVDGEGREWLRPYVTYLNTAYRDVSFDMGMGGRVGGEYDWHFSASSELFGAGLRVFALRETREPDLYLTYDKHPLLEPGALYETPSETAWGLRVTGRRYGIDASAGLKFSRTYDRLAFIYAPGGVYPANLPGASGVTRLMLEAEKNWIRLSADIAGGKAPEVYSTLEAAFSPKLQIAGIRSVELTTSLKYSASHERWVNPDGTLREKVPAAVSLGADIGYPVTGAMRLRAGGENLLSSDIRPAAGVMNASPRYYLILEAGFR